MDAHHVKYAIKIGSKTLEQDCPVESIWVHKRVNKIPYAKIVLYDGDAVSQDFALANAKIFDIGETITIEAGYGNQLEKIFEGLITKVAVKSKKRSSPTLVITCKDRAFQTTLVPKTAHFENSKDSDLLKQILGSYSRLSHTIETTKTLHEGITQYEISDWDFLNIRAEANGQVVIVNDGKINVKQPKTSGKGSQTYRYGVDFTEFESEVDMQDQLKSTAGRTWDSKKQKIELTQADDPGEKSIGSLSHKDVERHADRSGFTLSHGGVEASQVKALASSILERRRMAKVKGTFTVAGHASLRHGELVNIEKGATYFQGSGYLSGIKHYIAKNHWSTELSIGLEAERYMHKYHDIGGLPAAGMLAPIHGLQTGIVKNTTKDPEKSHRIFVHLPLVHTKPQEGIWCRLATFYATQQSGAFFVPEINDEVVVGFIHDDLRSPIIIGSLYSNKHAPATQINQENSIKSLISREKLALQFNDIKDGPSITMQTPKGGVLTISDEKNKMGIQIEDQNGNKISLTSKGISIVSRKDIKLNAGGSIMLSALDNCVIKATKDANLSGMNVNAKASMKASLIGNANTEVKSNMVTIIKGTTVLIN